jgi:hypothetical protein
MERNMYNALTVQFVGEHKQRDLRKFDYSKIYYCHNYSFLSKYQQLNLPNSWTLVDDKLLYTFMTDPSITKNIKKRIFMDIASCGRIDDVESWSKGSFMILHNWINRQRFNNLTNKYYGDFDLILFMGDQKLLCHYNSENDEYNLSKSNLIDPSVIYQFLIELCSILDIPIVSLIKKMGKGDWIIENKKALREQKVGFKLIDGVIDVALNLYDCSIKIDKENDRVILLDGLGKQIYSVEMGVIPTEFYETDLPDFEIFGLSFKQLCEIGAFSMGFNVLYKSKKETFKLIQHELIVDKPRISGITQQRLKLDKEWSLRIEKESKQEELAETKIQLSDTTGYSQFFFTNVEEVKEKIVDWITTPFDDFLTAFSGTDFFNTMKTSYELMNTTKLFLQLRNLKYDFICHQVLSDMRINKECFGVVNKVLPDNLRRPVLWSMISLYDRMYSNTNMISPKGVHISLSEDFLQLISSEMEELDLNKL